ncbi:MAG: N-acetylmuramoyl-L-alanine amidase [Xanthobacteraceae bacterium]
MSGSADRAGLKWAFVDSERAEPDLSFRPDSKLVSDVAASPNHEERKDGRAPDMILLHYTGMQSALAALARLRDAAGEQKVSAHYFVDDDGTITQLVPEARRAWHAGLSFWENESDVNSRSIGVEIVNPGHEFGYPDFPPHQVDAVIALCRDVAARHQIRADRLLAHSDVAPGRKQDPGEKFPWHRLHMAGVGHWVAPTPIADTPRLSVGDSGETVSQLQLELAQYGYGISVTGDFDAATRDVVAAFQRHFRPARVDGVADGSTLTTLTDLLAARPSVAA